MINNRNTGPTPLPPEVLSAMAQQPLSHRSAAFSDAYREVTARLSTLVNAPAPALLLSCSGTGGLEAGIASLVSAGRRTLVLTAGNYGDLLARLAGNFTDKLEIMRFAPGETYDLTALAAKLVQADYDAILLTHSESSTGIYHPVAETIGTIRRHSDALVLVDVVSSLGATSIDMVQWGADVLIGATQKSLMAPAGMAVAYLSPRAEHFIERHPADRYLHLSPWLDAGRAGGVPYTPAVNVFQGLQAALALIFDEGLAARYQRHRDAASRCQRFFAQHESVRCFAPPAHASHSITALSLATTLSAGVVKSRLEQAHQTIVSTGLGPLADRLIRVGHMGYFAQHEIDAALNAIAQVVLEEEGRHGN